MQMLSRLLLPSALSLSPSSGPVQVWNQSGGGDGGGEKTNAVSSRVGDDGDRDGCVVGPGAVAPAVAVPR